MKEKLKVGDVLYTFAYPHKPVTVRAVKNKYLYLEGYSDDHRVDIETLYCKEYGRYVQMTESEAKDANSRYESKEIITSFIYRGGINELTAEQLSIIAEIIKKHDVNNANTK